MNALVAVIRTALERAQVVVLSGGLGPTADDLTRQALASAIGRPLVTDPSALRHIRDLFTRRGREMPERNVVQAEFPEGCDVVFNPHGTAPGIHFAGPRNGDSARHLFALPGVPAELKQMWGSSVEPLLSEIVGDRRQVIRHRVIRCFGAGESDIERRLPDLVRRGRHPAVGITASRATISLRVTAESDSPENCLAIMEPTVATIYECLGTLVYGEGDDTLQDVVGRLLGRHGFRLATAEWGTHGLLASWLAETKEDAATQNGEPLSTSTPPDDNQRDVFPGSVVIGTRHALEGLLAIPASKGDSGPEGTARLVADMATRVRDRLGADLGLAVGPRPQEPSVGRAPGEIQLALATPDGVIPASFNFAAHPAIRQQLAAKQALNLARLWLLERGNA